MKVRKLEYRGPERKKNTKTKLHRVKKGKVRKRLNGNEVT